MAKKRIAKKVYEGSSSCPFLNEYNEKFNQLQNKLEDMEVLLKALALQGISKELGKIVKKEKRIKNKE